MKRKKKAGIHHIRKREGFLKKHKQSIFEDTKKKKNHQSKRRCSQFDKEFIG